MHGKLRQSAVNDGHVLNQRMCAILRDEVGRIGGQSGG
jgi:hypothetical protein